MENFASYEKSIEATVTTVKHTVRIQLNSSKADIYSALSHVPDTAKVVMVIDDDAEGFGEIIFTETVV